MAVKQDSIFTPHNTMGSPIWGGIASLGYPTMLVVTALGVGFRQGGGVGEFAASLAATLLFLIAAPTAWVFAFPFIDVTRFTVILTGIVTSAPLWYIFGVALFRTVDDWFAWFRRYVVSCVIWTAANLVVLGVIAGLTG